MSITHPKPLERDPVFDVIVIDDTDSRFRSSLPEEDSQQDFQIAPEIINLSEDYFSEEKEPRSIRDQSLPNVPILDGMQGEDTTYKPFYVEIEERSIRIEGLSSADNRMEYDQAFQKIIIPYVRKDRLKKTVDQLIRTEFFKKKIQVSDSDLNYMQCLKIIQQVPSDFSEDFTTAKRIIRNAQKIFQTFVKDFLSLDKLFRVIDEETRKRIGIDMPINWAIPREQVNNLHQTIKTLISTMQQNFHGPTSDLEIKDWIQRVKKPFKHIRSPSCYFISEKMLPSLLYLTGSTAPRLLRIKMELSQYFKIEKMFTYATDKVLKYISDLKSNCSYAQRDEIVRLIQSKKTPEEIEQFFITQQLPQMDFRPKEKSVLEPLLEIFLPSENDLFDEADLLFQEEPYDPVFLLRQNLNDVHLNALQRLDRYCWDVKLYISFKALCREYVSLGMPLNSAILC